MIELVQSVVRRGRRPVLNAARLALPAEGTVGLVGVNGAGKSTLCYALTGGLPKRAGTVRIGELTDHVMGYAPQQPAFPAWLRVEAVVRMYGTTFDDLMTRHEGLLLEELAGKKAGELSVGQRQVLSVALALMLDAPLTLLDEPFAPLDFRRRIALVRLLQSRRDAPRGRMTIVSSQAAVDLLDTCSWIVVLRNGQYVYSGEAAALTGEVADPSAARQRFEDAIMTLLGAAAPATAQG